MIYLLILLNLFCIYLLSKIERNLDLAFLDNNGSKINNAIGYSIGPMIFCIVALYINIKYILL